MAWLKTRVRWNRIETKNLSEFVDAPDQDFESIALSKCVGKKLIVNATEFKALGKRDGVVLSLTEKIAAQNESWDKVHTSTDRIVSKFKSDKVQDELKQGNNLAFTVVSGVNQNGTWVDVE